MFQIEYEDWESVCTHLLKQNRGRMRRYLQWYPFSCLTNAEKTHLQSKSFFDEYIKTGFFLYSSDTWHITNNYLTKSDGNYRHASLVSPIMYLLALAIGKNIAKRYISTRQNEIEVYYAGNFNEDKLSYHGEHAKFVKRIKEIAPQRQYYIKTDIKDFFSNIDVSDLFNSIANNLKNTSSPLSQKNLKIYKELFLYFGKGEFPLLDNCATTSYLSTIVYLEDADKNLFDYITFHETDIESCVLIRYVDDLYILFNSNLEEHELKRSVNRIMDCYVSELKSLNLSLNRGKTELRATSDILMELARSLYEEPCAESTSNIFDFVTEHTIKDFLTELVSLLSTADFNATMYKELIVNHFHVPQIKALPNDNYNDVVYRKNEFFSDAEVIKLLTEAVEIDDSFINVDAQRFVAAFTKTKCGNLIKKLLNKLFIANRNGTWKAYDTSIAIYYLLHRNFNHRDLLNIIKKEDGLLFEYIKKFCNKSFMSTFSGNYDVEKTNFLHRIFHKNDAKLFLLYFFYNIERKKGTVLSAYAYYKSFFDRISAHIAVHYKNDTTKGKPNYRNYYTESQLKKLYCDCSNGSTIINKAHMIRNANPLSHSSADLWDNNNAPDEIVEIIRELEELIKEKLSILLACK